MSGSGESELARALEMPTRLPRDLASTPSNSRQAPSQQQNHARNMPTSQETNNGCVNPQDILTRTPEWSMWLLRSELADVALYAIARPRADNSLYVEWHSGMYSQHPAFVGNKGSCPSESPQNLTLAQWASDMVALYRRSFRGPQQIAHG